MFIIDSIDRKTSVISRPSFSPTVTPSNLSTRSRCYLQLRRPSSTKSALSNDVRCQHPRSLSFPSFLSTSSSSSSHVIIVFVFVVVITCCLQSCALGNNDVSKASSLRLSVSFTTGTATVCISPRIFPGISNFSTFSPRRKPFSNLSAQKLFLKQGTSSYVVKSLFYNFLREPKFLPKKDL